MGAVEGIVGAVMEYVVGVVLGCVVGGWAIHDGEEYCDLQKGVVLTVILAVALAVVLAVTYAVTLWL